MGIFTIFAGPLGYVLRWFTSFTPNYFLAILLFTVVVRLLMFPLSIKNQKSQMDRARLAPRLERIQKKYAGDRQKMQEKQQALYQKEGVSMTGGCLPMLVQMIVLMSIIGVIYKPLTYVERMDKQTLNVCVSAVLEQTDEANKKDMEKKLAENSYYQEMNLMQELDTHRDHMKTALVEAGYSEEDAEAAMVTMEETSDDFKIFGVSLLEMPNKGGLGAPNWLWLIAISSGAAALLQSIVSMRYSQAAMSEEQKKMAGCSNGAMMYGMPVFSLIIAFTVPGGVALYWTFSNLLGIVQTVVLNAMYNPAKARAQAQADYEERRRRKAEDRARLRESRLAEQAAWQKEENEKRLAAQGKGKRKNQPAEKAEKKETAPAEEAPVDEIPAEPVNEEN